MHAQLINKGRFGPLSLQTEAATKRNCRVSLRSNPAPVNIRVQTEPMETGMETDIVLDVIEELLRAMARKDVFEKADIRNVLERAIEKAGGAKLFRIEKRLLAIEQVACRERPEVER
jgi:hypothetical protein